MAPNSPEHCPSCGTLLDRNETSPSLGLCPRCLLAGSLETTAGQPASETPAPEDLAAAFPDLKIIELIGKGGMGSVYKARQKSLDRFVALKLLPSALANDSSFAHRFEGEAKALASLNHPNIVTIHEFGRRDDFYFLLMEFVDGPNLRQLICDHRFTPEEALSIVPPLCEALEFAHEKDIVHRDIKPENLLLDRNGRLKIADFGIARIMGKRTPLLDTPLGTPAYMAPEQKHSPDQADSRADIYSLGVILYELLTGERPKNDLTPPSTKAASLDVRLDEVVLRALDNDPERRWQSTTDFNTRIQNILSDTPSESANEEIPGKIAPSSTCTRAYLSLIFAIFPALLVLFMQNMQMASETEKKREEARSQKFITKLEEQKAILIEKASEKNLAPDALREIEEQKQALESKLSGVRNEVEARRSKLQSPNLSMVIVSSLALCLSIAGLVLGWRHLRWLKKQNSTQPALVPALIGALFWPVLILACLTFVVIALPLNMRGWFFTSTLAGALWAFSLSILLVYRTLAWIKNLPFSFLKNHPFFSIPLIMLAIIIPISATHQIRENKIVDQQREDSPTIRHLVDELWDSHLQLHQLQLTGLGENHPDIRASQSEILVFEERLQEIGYRTFRKGRRDAYEMVIADFKAKLAALEQHGLGDQHPDRVALKKAISDYENKLSNLLPPKMESQLDLASFLFYLMVSLCLAAIAALLIYKSRKTESAQTK
ncbi:serine/threonine protein kinase [Akkermansiaceae bacterium]|nr:serine/threonine protein kinase [Akkermansiaceae bacterium]